MKINDRRLCFVFQGRRFFGGKRGESLLSRFQGMADGWKVKSCISDSLAARTMAVLFTTW
ncbi:hypothetical protein [Dialister sp.]|uniref:hypothetical protein n=1 Tax=Dialister sp. TaxID=1955814 RepID=UPI0025EC141A|nr:hypothetical protein [Dialister sp.]